MSTPLVSVVIRCRNEEQHIGRLLAGIIEQSVREVEIIAVDSGSTDATLAIASRYPVEIRHIRREEFYSGRSLNVGCAAARGEFTLIASAHVYPLYRDWIASMIEPLDDPATAVVYGKQRGDERVKYAEHRLFATLFQERAPAPEGSYFCNNANSAIRRALWQQAPYDESPTGLEDLAWVRLQVAQGYRVRNQPEAKVIHVRRALAPVVEPLSTRSHRAAPHRARGALRPRRFPALFHRQRGVRSAPRDARGSARRGLGRCPSLSPDALLGHLCRLSPGGCTVRRAEADFLLFLRMGPS